MQRRPSKPWFAQKRYGYGAGLPIAWQGWVVLGLFLVVIAFTQIVQDAVARIALVGVAVAILCVVCALKTKGGWRWRWGGED